jgi:hypothetical protein
MLKLNLKLQIVAIPVCRIMQHVVVVAKLVNRFLSS